MTNVCCKDDAIETLFRCKHCGDTRPINLAKELLDAKKRGQKEELEDQVNDLIGIELIMEAEQLKNTDAYSALNSLRISKEQGLKELM